MRAVACIRYGLAIYNSQAPNKIKSLVWTKAKNIGKRGAGVLISWWLCTLCAFPIGERGLHALVLHEYAYKLNQVRVLLGLPPLKLNDALCEAAQTQANEVLIMQECSHTDRQGRRVDRRATEVGYSFLRIAENLAAGQPTWERALEDWLNSPPHRTAILAPEYREIGIGSAWINSGRYTHAWAHVLGVRKGVYPLIINLDALWTDSPSVRLYVHGARRASAMRFSNNGEDWTDWMSPQEWVDWQLPDEPGERTVYVQLLIGGRIYESSDNIILR